MHLNVKAGNMLIIAEKGDYITQQPRLPNDGAVILAWLTALVLPPTCSQVILSTIQRRQVSKGNSHFTMLGQLFATKTCVFLKPFFILKKKRFS